MLKLIFKNAKVRDTGFGLSINGESLDNIISTALGTKVDSNYGVSTFSSECCNVIISIDPQPITTFIETDEEVWHDVAEMEECKREQFEKSKKTNSEE